MINKLLQSQINEYSGREIPAEFRQLFKEISETYDKYELETRENFNIQHLQNTLEQEIKKREAAEQQLRKDTYYSNIRQRMANICGWELDLTTDDITDAPLRWSEEAYRIFGFEPRNTVLNYGAFLKILHPDDQLIALEQLKESIKSRTPYNLTHRVIASDGTEKIIHTLGEVLIDAVINKPLIIIGVIQDITEKKRTSEALQAAHTELKTLFENMNECSFTVDMCTNQVIQMSKACEEIYGYSVPEFLNNSNLWFDVILEEDKSVIHNNYAVLNAGRQFTQEYRINHKNGDIRWVESNITPTLKDGVLIRIDGLTSDITKRKEAEIALKASEHRFRTLLQNNADGIMIVNKNSEIIFASDSIYPIMGYHPDEIIGSCSFNYIYPEDLQLLKNNLTNVLQSPSKAIAITYRRVKKDGTLIWCEGISTNLINDPAVNGIVINFRDITERRQYIEALKLSNDELKKSNDELDRFVYSVSHDLRAPLSSILGAIEYSETVTDDPEMLETLSLMKGSARKLDSFILDLLDYSKNTRLDLQIERIELPQLLNEIKDHLKYMGTVDTSVDIRINLHGSSPFYSDRNRLSVILNNLISNGIRYSKTDINNPFVEVIININDKAALITIKDNGIGIDEKHHDKIFDMFFRASSKSEGSGLGLYIVKDTVNKLNGSLRFKSELRKGTEYNLHIPNMIPDHSTGNYKLNI